MKECFVYVIGREDGPVKVGISARPCVRLRELQIGCPFKIEILHQRQMRDRDHALTHERIFHEVWEQNHLHGEWFDVCAEIAAESVDTSIFYEEYPTIESLKGLQ